MVRIREARKAFRRFHARYFASYPAELPLTRYDLPWLLERLRRSGDPDAEAIAARLEPAGAGQLPGEDVDPVVRRLQTESFRRMSAERKLELADQLRALATELQHLRDVPG